LIAIDQARILRTELSVLDFQQRLLLGEGGLFGCRIYKFKKPQLA